MNIREATKSDWENIWPIFSEIVSAGETYAYDPATTKEQAEKIWLETQEKFTYSRKTGKFLAPITLKQIKLGQEIMFVIVAIWFHLPPEAKG